MKFSCEKICFQNAVTTAARAAASKVISRRSRAAGESRTESRLPATLKKGFYTARKTMFIAGAAVFGAKLFCRLVGICGWVRDGGDGVDNNAKIKCGRSILADAMELRIIRDSFGDYEEVVSSQGCFGI
jgi:hypothetical protein